MSTSRYVNEKHIILNTKYKTGLLITIHLNMKNKIKFTLLFALFISFVCCSAYAKNDEVIIRIAKYKGDKACAISYTFDDGLKEHYTLIAPYFDKLGFKGTFWINGSKINQDNYSIKDTSRMTWPELKEMSDNGHEISNHGWAHKNFGRHTIDEIREDVFKNDSAIFANTGIMPRTFCYPNNKKTPEGIILVSENRVGTRTQQRSIGSKPTEEDLEKWVNTLIQTNDWGVGMTHGINYGYDAFKDPQIFWNHLEKVKARENEIWVGTFREVSAYIKEQENTELEITKKKKEISVTPRSLLDKDLYTEQLTAVIEKQDVKEAIVKQGKRKLTVQLLPDKVIFDFDPFGETIHITLK